MEKKNADQETVSGASGILSVSQSFSSFGRDYKGIIPARDAKSMSWRRPNLSNPKIPGLLRRVFKGSDRKARHQEVGEWSLEECRHSIMELAKELNRVVKNSAIPTPVSSEDTCSLEECRCFIMKWADELDKLVQTPKQSQSAGQVETRKGAELRNKEDLPGPEGEELSEGAGQNKGEELNQSEEQRLKDGHDIIMQWARELKTVPENSVSAGEAVEQGLAELVKEWKRGKLSNILPIMEFIMWALIKEEADKGMLKSLNIGAGRCIPDLVWQWIHKASVDSLNLDLDTAHPRLTLPVDEKQVKRKRQDPQRFDYRRCVLGKEGFTSGRHYWELGVGENTFWRLGVSRESAPKKGKFSMTPQQGYWTVGWSGDEDKDEFIALTDPQTPLPRSLKPQKLGVYLDYEEGQLSFYNVETRSHIYTFTDMEFNPNEKLYPFFWSLEYKDLALVSPGKMNDSSFLLLVWEGILAASVDVTLDPDTAHPWLILSAEGKRVRLGETRQSLPDTPERFDLVLCVLGREGYTSERRYWQVQVGGNTGWRLGISRESAERKGGFSMTPQQGYWTVEWSGYGFTALTDPETPLPRSLKPQKLGVYLDYEEGQLSFYNVETRSHIYTFTDMEFNPNEKLYPFFCTWDENTNLVLESPDPVSAAD
ncbi:nuclear factor 7, ovary-like [Acipenser ruthenus]|uniref:nuclear factor 7, ovary-like n=1 Tax=Acipenser ruthenus TaxID=7906 RepID=UPI0027418197|nr:nuclear factor 7, ovary-like [Acipenser ruthenus]